MMDDIVDFHSHLYPDPDIEVEFELSSYDVAAIARNFADRVRESPVDHSVAIVMDDSFLRDDAAREELLSVQEESGVFSLVFLVDPFEEDSEEYVGLVADVGGVGIKLHPYLQEFGTGEQFEPVIQTLKTVEENDLLTIVDCNYAGEHAFRFNGVRVAHAAAEKVSTPIVLAHAGNARVLDGFVTARAFDNIWLDTSFTLPWWRGSSVATDIAFAMEKMGMDRWLWGTDVPYAQPQDACLEGVEEFLVDHDIDEHAEKLFSENPRLLLESVSPNVT